MSLNSSGVERAAKNTRYDSNGNRRCSRCGDYKPLGDYYGERSAYCKPCNAAYYGRPWPPQGRSEESRALAAHKRRITVQERLKTNRVEWLELKRAGKTYAEIAALSGFTRQYVQKVIGPTDRERELILALDGNHCRLCGTSGENARLDIHHVTYSGSIDNTVTVCQPCHRHLDGICRELGIDLDIPAPEPVGQEASGS